MKKSILNLNYQIEVLSENQTKEEIVNSIQVISNNPEVVITKRIKEETKIENQKNNLTITDAIYTDYFRCYKKN